MKDIKVYNQLSKEYNQLFLENILSFQTKLKEDGKAGEYYIDFYPSFGIAENEHADFLVYGQAANGWGSGFEIATPIDIDNKLSESILASNKYFEPLNHNPLDFINVQWDMYSYEEYLLKDVGVKDFYKGNYRANRSFFWNVVFKLINDYYGTDRNQSSWSSKLVWSNLYKIAPEDANPSDYEQNIQMEYSIKLLELEIKEVKPKYCIILTNGKWWEPFGKALIQNFPTIQELPSKIHYNEKFDSTKIIVTERPRFGGHKLQDLFVHQILSLIKS
ncbi:MAG: hypothetical protein KA713_09440 [Chryseotalea sp. WA131a]|nr:MAG: hypothetical protein KA713_09440 [Chryseotalea sp. WA131a]